MCGGGEEDYYEISILKGNAHLECIYTVICETLLFFLTGHFAVTVVTFLILATTDDQVVEIGQPLALSLVVRVFSQQPFKCCIDLNVNILSLNPSRPLILILFS